jgi:hypothetical protein
MARIRKGTTWSCGISNGLLNFAVLMVSVAVTDTVKMIMDTIVEAHSRESLDVTQTQSVFRAYMQARA